MTSSPPLIRPSRSFLVRWWATFLLLSLPALVLLSHRYRILTPVEPQTAAVLFSWLLAVGHIFFLLVLALLPTFILILTRSRITTSVVGVLSVSILILYLALDTIVFGLYRFHIGPPIFELILGGAAKEIFVFPWSAYLKATLVSVGVLSFEIALSFLAWRIASRLSRLRVLWSLVGIFAVAGIASQALFAWADAVAYTPITRQASLLPGYFPLTAKRFLRNLGVSVKEVRVANRNAPDTDLHYPLKPLQCSGGSSSNILLLVIDSWVFHGLTENITPNIFRFASDRLQFDDHWSGGSATRSGIFSMFYGIPATYWQAILERDRGPVLIDELLAQNYQFGIFANAPLTSPEFNRTVFSRVPGLRLQSKGSDVIARDREITDEFLKFLDTRDHSRPFFSFLFFDAPHAIAVPDDESLPFQPSLKEIDYFALNADYDATPFLNRYFNSVHFVDALIGKILARLERDGRLADTIVMITGDHGQEFNENGLNFWGHNGNFTRYQAGVPLIVNWPGQTHEHIAYRTSHLDFAPTILSRVLNCVNPPADFSDGFDLLTAGGRERLLLGNYGQFAIVEPESITLFQPYGGVEVLDTRYHPRIGVSPSRDTILAALELRSRFFRR